MLLVRYVDAERRAVVGVERDGFVTPLPGVPAVSSLLRMSSDQVRDACSYSPAGGQSVRLEDLRLLPPVDGRMEVWAAGVTYRRSRLARAEESARSADVYESVYEAVRPELFFKSAAWRVSGHGEQVSVRADSHIDVPEPELALVLSNLGSVVGYTVCNDVSSRSIEGENPLYLPQAKVYLGACAVGPGIRPAWEVPDPLSLCISMTLVRDGATVWQGTTSTAELHRTFDELVEHLFREDVFPDGVVLATGTSLVPELPFSLQHGDEVRIEIEDIGELISGVVKGKSHLEWLAGAVDDAVRDPATSVRA